VTMLNDLYLIFDTTLAKFNVYKVCLTETSQTELSQSGTIENIQNINCFPAP